MHPVNRDSGSADNASDWFDIVGIQTGSITKLALFVDISMTLATVAYGNLLEHALMLVLLSDKKLMGLKTGSNHSQVY